MHAAFGACEHGPDKAHELVTPRLGWIQKTRMINNMPHRVDFENYIIIQFHVASRTLRQPVVVHHETIVLSKHFFGSVQWYEMTVIFAGAEDIAQG